MIGLSVDQLYNVDPKHDESFHPHRDLTSNAGVLRIWIHCSVLDCLAIKWLEVCSCRINWGFNKHATSQSSAKKKANDRHWNSGSSWDCSASVFSIWDLYKPEEKLFFESRPPGLLPVIFFAKFDRLETILKERKTDNLQNTNHWSTSDNFSLAETKRLTGSADHTWVSAELDFW